VKRRRPKKGTPPRAATSDAETLRRVETILRLRLDGGQLHDLRVYANDPSKEAVEARGGPPWGVTDDELAKLINRADDLLIARTEREGKRAVALQLARRDSLYLRAINAGDYAVGLSILRDQAALLGMYPNVAELKRLVKEQDKLLTAYEAEANAPRQIGPVGEGAAAPEPAEGADEAPGEAADQDGRGGG
jgi:hypothetical protein